MSNKIVNYNNKKIFVYNAVFDHRENINIYNNIINCSFTRTNIDIYLYNNLDRDAKWWGIIDPKSDLSGIINPKYIDTLHDLDWGRVAITHQYINYSTSNTVDIMHTDVPHNDNTSYTILHYANHTWDPNWHGETMFYSDDCSEVIYSQIIKPGTVVLFDSRIQHCAVPCTISALYPRFTIATKLFLK